MQAKKFFICLKNHGLVINVQMKMNVVFLSCESRVLVHLGRNFNSSPFKLKCFTPSVSKETQTP